MEEPNRAPQADAPEPRDETTAASVLTGNATMQDRPAGGGLAGQSAVGGPTADLPEQATTPSNPNSPAVAGDAGSLEAEREAKHLTVAGAPAPDRSSQ